MTWTGSKNNSQRCRSLALRCTRFTGTRWTKVGQPGQGRRYLRGTGGRQPPPRSGKAGDRLAENCQSSHLFNGNPKFRKWKLGPAPAQKSVTTPLSVAVRPISFLCERFFFFEAWPSWVGTEDSMCAMIASGSQPAVSITVARLVTLHWALKMCLTSCLFIVRYVSRDETKQICLHA